MIEKHIEHTNLRAEATKKHIDKLIEEAQQYQFRGICVNGSWIRYARENLKDSSIKLVTVVGFPLGANISQSKIHEAKLAVQHGADEIDMVINVGMLKERKYNYVLQEINKIKAIISNRILKVIVETALLSQNEKIEIAKIVLRSNADYIKTSTGFSFSGAQVEDIKLFAKILSHQKKIKASAGIKTLQDARLLLEAGSDTLGTSSGIKIITAEKKEEL